MPPHRCFSAGGDDDRERSVSRYNEQRLKLEAVQAVHQSLHRQPLKAAVLDLHFLNPRLPQRRLEDFVQESASAERVQPALGIEFGVVHAVMSTAILRGFRGDKLKANRRDTGFETLMSKID